MNLVLVEHEHDAKPLLASIPESRRSMVSVATPAQAAERLQPYLDAGFGGFTLSNQTLPTKEAIALGGELIKLVRGSGVTA
jgi:alkanesulfonate monooxygenase SsuD/methylene tetrahydromethanopterin reductase-like flavin-dependent oxidoreductase (luciferase family)